MKRLYLIYPLLLIPVLIIAQDQPPILKDAWKNVPGITSSFKFNDHMGVIQVNHTDTTFELLAVDDKLSVLWRRAFHGYGVDCGKFKNNLLAISRSGHSKKKGVANPYYALLIDPASGKIVLQNKIFEQEAKNTEIATAFFAPDGDNFVLAVRQADIRNSFFSSYKNQTEDLTLISLNEKLEPAYLKPKVPDEAFVGMTMNHNGDLFLLTINNHQNLQARRYEHGSIEPSEPISQTCDNIDKVDLFNGSTNIASADEDRNALYLSIGHITKDDDREIITAKFDFAKSKSQAISEVFTRKHYKEIVEKYAKEIENIDVAANNDFLTVHLGLGRRIRVDYIATKNGKLITVSGAIYAQSEPSGGLHFSGAALIISYYDSDLKQLYQRVMPGNYTQSFPLPAGYNWEANQLKIVSNSDDASALGQLDLSTGKWLNIAWINNDANNSDKHIIWFSNNFVVPILHKRAFGKNYNFDLMLAGY